MKKIFILVFSLFSFMLLNAQTTKTVGGSGANYTSLELAFDAINNGTLQGEITLQITGSTTETSSASLNASGSGSANYTSVNIYPTQSGLSISGNLSSALVDLYGADNVTIDGRINLGGTTASLTITNTNTYKYAYAIRFRQSAESNIIRYSYLKASSLGYGVVRFEGSSTGNGCDNNIIEYCNITNSGNPLVRAIYSSGSDGRENSGNIIRYNNIYDFFSSTSTSYGISLGWKSTGWTITGNSLYQTTTVSPEGDYRYYAMDISQGDDNIVSGNYIGGSAPECEGTPFTIEAMVPYYFCAIYVNGGTAGYIQDNVIRNIKCKSSEDNPWDGIFLNSGNIDVTGNTIGSGTGTNSITISTPVAVATASISSGEVTGLTIVNGGSGYDDSNPPTVKIYLRESTITATATATVSGGVVTALTLDSGGSGYTSVPRVTFDGQSNYSTSHGIIQNSKGTVNITGNTIGSITTVGTDYYTHGFETVYVRSGPSITNISNNIIGSETTANSIHVSSTAALSTIKQDLYGLYSSNTGTTTIFGNTIANLTNAYVAGNSGSYCRGIRTTEGLNTIQNNTVRDMSIAGGAGSSLVGIDQSSDISGQTISGNEVYNLSNLNSAAVEVDVYGIYFKGPTAGTNNINANFVHSIGITSTNYRSSMIGIYLNEGYSTCSNNIINIGNTLTLGYSTVGIWDYKGLNNCYFNTVYIGGSVSTASTGKTENTAALWNDYNNGARDYRNNILVNARTGGTSGNHFAIRLKGLTGVTIDYNDYYVSGTGGIFGQLDNANKVDLAAWKLATSQDTHSLNIDPVFVSAGGDDADDYITSATLSGVTIPGITTTYHGITRSDPPRMGALEVSPTFTWQGNTSIDFATASNWTGGAVPPNGADIKFAETPANDCYLDQNRTLKNITNTSGKKLVLNAHQLTLTRDIASATENQIDANIASSALIFAGTAAQTIPTGVFVNNTLNALTIDNSAGVTQNGDITVSTSFTLTAGDYSIGANTLTLNGAISTTSGILTGGSSSNIILGGSGDNTILPALTLNNLTINRANGISMGGSVSVAGTLALTNGTLSLGANTLTISGNAPTCASGTIDASNASATIAFTNASAITLAAALFTGNINNLTINGEGLTASSDLTVNGVLNLQSANPSATKGSLDMSTFILNMGSAATTTGVGDVTGIVKRTTILANTEYTFGNQFTSATFPDFGTLPTEVALKISIGTVPSWKSDAVKRFYELIHVGGSNTRAVLKGHYLDSELNGNSEEDLTDLSYIVSSGTIVERGRSDINTTENWVSLSNLDFSILPTSFGEMELGFAVSTTDVITWDGSVSTDWGEASNWTPAYSPDASKIVIIPDASTTPNDPTLSATSTIKSITIQTGAILNSGATSVLTIGGAGGAWISDGTFNPSTGKVIFDHAVDSDIVTIAGKTNFYTIEVSANTTIQPVSGNILSIEGQWIASASSIVDFSSINNTVEWNGGVGQTIVNPVGIGGNSGYYNLILSGSGAKTTPVTAFSIKGDFTISGTAQVTGGSPITLKGDLTIGEGSSYNTGNFDHTVGGDVVVNGTVTAASGHKITLDGTAAQGVFSDSYITFQKLNIDNESGVQMYTGINVEGELSLVDGNLSINSDTLGINGTLTRAAGFLEVSNESSISFGGSTLLTLPDNLFSAAPTINNVFVDCSGGVTLGNQNMTINGFLKLTSGVFDLVDNSLTMAGTSPTRTSGTIDATDPASTLIFSNDLEVISLPDALFSGNIQNMTINGPAGVISLGDIAVDAVLSLAAENPSPTAGALNLNYDSGMKTLTMGANATTTGVGDVTGTIKRTSFVVGTVYTFGNQYSTVEFIAGGTTFPTSLEVSVSIGAAPSWKTEGIKRIYDFVQTGTPNYSVDIATHYLDSELNGNDENDLAQWTYSNSTLSEWGRSDASSVENWVKIIGATIADLGNFENTLSPPVNTSYTWNGSQSTDWNTAANWTPSVVPTSILSATIPDVANGNDPVISSSTSADCENLVVEAGATLTLKSDAGNTGSLIISGTATGNVTVERFLTHDRWHYISGQTNISGNFNTLSMGLTGGVNSDQFYRWDENSGYWIDILNGNGSGTLMDDEGFVVGKGYGINYITTDKTLSFTGTPYVSDQSIALQKTSSSSNEGANLVGNPFTSTIAVNSNADETNNFLDKNVGVLDASYVAVYLWNESEGWTWPSNADYVAISNATPEAEYIQPGQAFMVVAKTDEASLSFPTAIRKHGSANYYKHTEAGNVSRFELGVVDPEGQTNSVLIAFMPGMTTGLDPSYDAGKLSANPNFSLYTRLVEDNGVDFAIQALPNDDVENMVIPVGVDVAEGTLCEFSINSETMDGYPIYLQDTKENSVINIKDQTYSTVVTESGTGRFFLHFKDVNGVAENSTNTLQVWASNSVINIVNTDNLEGDITVVNMYGQNIHKSVLTRDRDQQIDLTFVPIGYYIVSIVTEDGVLNKKVYL